MDFSTTCRLGMPDTSFKGRNTLTALKVLKSKRLPEEEPPLADKVINLHWKKKKTGNRTKTLNKPGFRITHFTSRCFRYCNAIFGVLWCMRYCSIGGYGIVVWWCFGMVWRCGIVVLRCCNSGWVTAGLVCLEFCAVLTEVIA